MDLLASLVDKSMVVVVERNTTSTRYRLLETIKAYGESHSDQRAELTALRDRHLAHYLTVAEQGFAGWLEDFSSGRELLDLEWDNLRAATPTRARSRRQRDTRTALRRVVLASELRTDPRGGGVGRPGVPAGEGRAGDLRHRGDDGRFRRAIQ